MNQITSSIALVLSGIFVLLTLTETWVYRKWDQAFEAQREIQVRLVNAQRLSTFTDQFVRRLAIDSQSDPALAEMLKRHQVKVSVTPSGNVTHFEVTPDTGAAATPPTAKP